jgi:hypothetical protein
MRQGGPAMLALRPCRLGPNYPADCAGIPPVRGGRKSAQVPALLSPLSRRGEAPRVPLIPQAWLLRGRGIGHAAGNRCRFDTV